MEQSSVTLEQPTPPVAGPYKFKLTWTLAFIITWLFMVVVSGAALVMIMSGMIPVNSKTDKDSWIEILSQILNACFTLSAFLVQPERFMLFIYTLRRIKGLKSKDIHAIELNETKINDAFSSITLSSLNVTKPTTPVWKWYTLLALLNLNCIFQYPITIVMWGYAANYKARVAWVVPVFLPLSFFAGAISGIWPILMDRNLKKKQNGSVEVNGYSQS